MRTTLVCSVCQKSGDLRPYGKDGALICFPCGMKNEKRTKEEFSKALDAAGPVAVLTESGLLRKK